MKKLNDINISWRITLPIWFGVLFGGIVFVFTYEAIKFNLIGSLLISALVCTFVACVGIGTLKK